MGIRSAGTLGLLGFIADRVLGSGSLATLAASAWGALMEPDPGEMTRVYQGRRSGLSDALASFGGFDMPRLSLFGHLSNLNLGPIVDRVMFPFGTPWYMPFRNHNYTGVLPGVPMLRCDLSALAP